MAARLLTAKAWRGFRLDRKPECWEVEGCVLHAVPATRCVSLVNRVALANFDLSLEWKLPVGGNSGIFYRLTEEGEEPWQTGLEMQLLHDAGHPDGRVPETRCGAAYGLLAPIDAPECPPGIYNIARVSVRGTRVEHWLNGVCVLSYDLASEAFRAAVARSKFRELPAFAAAPRGLVGLQHHGEEAWFRNVRIDVPPPPGPGHRAKRSNYKLA